MKSGLPIDEVLPALTDALASSRSVVLQAPPGAGKSTVVPLALLEQSWASGKRIIMLEPRRLATRAVAQRMAHTLSESVGRTVGYRMRGDTRVSRDTRIEVVTEGILTRMLQSDPALEGVAAVLFDEFHERNLQADLGLALTLDARDNLTPDLRLVIMSATLDGASVARLLGNAPIVTAQGRVFPVESRFMGKGAPLLPGVQHAPGYSESPEKHVAQIVQRALREESGDVLVFLPGAREIRRVQSILQAAELPPSVRLFPLFGELSAQDQDAALSPAAPGSRKVVLATNIAETSLTIEGVRVVVDSGLVRVSLFDPATGMSRLETRRISRASAEQRQGRAGRLEPGVCYRAWSEGSHRSLAPFTSPEIAEADLVPLALELASWGARDVSELRWLDEPPEAMLSSARDLLRHLGALDSANRITSHGREMARLGVHPRLAHMVLRAAELNDLPLAADLAALLSERDLLRGSSGARDADIRSRLDVLRGEKSLPGAAAGLARARHLARDLVKQVAAIRDGSSRGVVGSAGGAASRAAVAGGAIGGGVVGDRAVAGRGAVEATNIRSGTAVDAGVLLAFAYPDRIGRRRSVATGPATETSAAGSVSGPSRYTLANGRGAHFAEVQSLGAQEFIVAVDLDDRDRDARILLAAPVAREDIERYLSDRLESGEAVEWSSREEAVLARRFVRLDALVLEEKPLRELPVEAARSAMLQGVRELGIQALPWNRDARDLQARMEFVRGLEGGAGRAEEQDAWPAVSDEALAGSVDVWLAPWLDGVTRREHLSRLSTIDILRALLPWEQQRELDVLAPSHLTVPSGSAVRIDYIDDNAPVVSVRLQEVFGLEETPRIGGGRVPITFKLLSPAQRPMQVTRDLASFWRGAYAEVRKDLRGRYPKHYWPENPLEAEPTRGVRRRT